MTFRFQFDIGISIILIIYCDVTSLLLRYRQKKFTLTLQKTVVDCHTNERFRTFLYVVFLEYLYNVTVYELIRTILTY